MAKQPETPEDILLAHAAIHDASTVRCPKCKQEPGYSPEFTATCEGLTAELPKANLAADVAKVAERLDQAATRHTIKVNVTDVPAVKEQMAALAAMSELLDRIHDEAFPNDPYMLGRLHAEMERLGYGKDET